jgi:hypothetical protein
MTREELLIRSLPASSQIAQNQRRIIIRRPFLLYCMAFVAFQLSSCQSTDPQPAEFVSQAGGFSVMVPGEMKETLHPMSSPYGGFVRHQFMSTSTKNIYLASYADYPQEIIDASGPKTFLDNSILGFLGEERKLISNIEISVGQYPGVEFIAQGSGLFWTVDIYKSRYYLVGNRFYQLAVSWTKGDDFESRADAFLQSFTLFSA